MPSVPDCPAPLFSIITAVRNGAAHIEGAIDSLACQTFRDFEYIVIDGASTDGTVERLRRRSADITHWISEPDEGISDAFNKGVRAGRGRLILFLGADDLLRDERVLEDVARALPSFQQPFFIYGDADYEYAGGRVRTVRQNYTWRRFRSYSCLPHQAVFLDRWFFETYGCFDPALRYAMDYEHFARFIRQHPPAYMPRIIAVMRRIGRSTDVLATHAEMDLARRRHHLASGPKIVTSHVILRIKLAIGRLFRLNW